MNDVFISYRRDDSADICGRIYDRLETLLGAKRVFKDVDNIPPGVDFREHLNGALNSCNAALVVIGPKWLSDTGADGQRRIDDPNDFVRVEIEALLRRSIPVIPVLVYGATMPSSDQLPASLAPLAYRQAVIVRPDPDFRRDLEHVVGALKSSAAKRATRQRPPRANEGSSTPAAEAGWRWRPWVLLGGGLTQVIVIVGAVLGLWGGLGAPQNQSMATTGIVLIYVAWGLGALVSLAALIRAIQLHRPGWIISIVLCAVTNYLAGLITLIFAASNLGPRGSG